MSRLGDSGENELISQLRGFLRDNTSRRPGVGTVTRVGIKAVNVRLTETGTLYTNIDVIGGVAGLTEGATLYLLYFADNRVVGLRPGDGGISPQLQTVLDALAPSEHSHPSSFGLHVVLEVRPGATIVYPPDTAGLAAALAAVGSGEVIYLPPVSIAGDITVPAGVRLVGLERTQSVLAGRVSGSDSGSLERLTVSVTDNSDDTLVGINGPASGAFRLFGCVVTVAQAGAGKAYGLQTNLGGDLLVEACDVNATSVGSSGFGARVYDGDVYVIGGRLLGSTDRITLV